MPYIGQTGDLTSQYLSFLRAEEDFRPIGNTLYAPGTAVQLVPLNEQIYPDQKTVQPTSITPGQQSLVVGVVSDTFPGFNGSIGAPSYTSGANSTTTRGTQAVTTITAGYHSAVLVNQAGAGATDISNGTVLVPSQATPGYSQGTTTAESAYGTVGCAMLPTSGFASTALSAAALVQASQTDTITGAPAPGDTLSVTIQTPYTTADPGVAQTTTFTTPGLTAPQAVSTTTAAEALVAYLNGIPAFSTFYIASNVANVVTIAVNTLSSPFTITAGPGVAGQTVSEDFALSLSGIVGNDITFAVSATGGSIATAGGATLASGAGFFGAIPALVA